MIATRSSHASMLPCPTAQHPRRPRLAHILISPISCCGHRRHLLAPERALAGELAPLLLPGRIGVEREDQLPDVSDPIPAPTLHAKDRHHPGHACGEQRQRIKGPFTDPESACRPGAGQRR